MTAFTNATGAKPDVIMYYSGWFVPFPTSFATTAANNGAVPLVQMDPDNISVAAIASGKYDGYLSDYAEAVRAYRHPVILSFGHEMNGNWYPWGYKHTSPAVFVAAWRHVVKLFRALGARNVTWLWTVNIINDTPARAHPAPEPVVARQLLRELGRNRRLLPQAVLEVRSPVRADHRAVRGADHRPDTDRRDRRGARRRPVGQDRRSVRRNPAYGLLGFVWFDSTNTNGEHFGINSPAAMTRSARAPARTTGQVMNGPRASDR